MAHLSSSRAVDDGPAESPENAGFADSERRLRPSPATGGAVSYDGAVSQDGDADVIGAEWGLREVVARVTQVAPTDVPVLLRGETGSGKEVIARLLHARSRRASGPMIRVNCGAIAPDLVDSELFGHERGSFTGATAQRRGWFERAHGGTLFLDEIAELPVAAQVRLLRVLSEGTLERVGGSGPIRVSVRVVTATHRDLEGMCSAGQFREDLWYRISVFSVRIPALRERLGDVPALATHFAAKAGVRLTGVPLAPTEEDLGLLAGYPWPGNVRELAAVVERAAILGGGRRLLVAAALGDGARGARLVEPPLRAASAPFATLEEAVRNHICEALTRTRGRIEGANGAAELLGVNPHSLRGKMRKLGIDWARFRHAGPSGAG